MADDAQPPIVRRLVTLARWRRLILINTLLVAVVAVVVSLLLPEWYKSSASVFPPQEESFSVGTLSSIVAATTFGQGRASLPIWATPSDVYAAILKSRSVREEIIRRFDLMKVYKAKKMEDALLVLKSRAKVRVGGEGVVSLTMIDKDPQRAARIANDFISLLDERSRDRRRSGAAAVRAFLQTRVADCRDSLLHAELALQRIQEETGILVPDEQARALVESAVQIDLGRKMREVELGILRAQVGPGDPDRARLTREIGLLESQLTQLERGGNLDSTAFRVPLAQFPARSAAYARALRDVKIQEALYELLTEQFEQYRIMELRDTPTLQVLDTATPADKRYRPIRWLICTIATGLAFLFSCAVALALDGWERLRRERPDQWRVLDAVASNLHPRQWFARHDNLPAP
jgi:tyrosine-protein kinase Etk/Wzc